MNARRRRCRALVSLEMELKQSKRSNAGSQERGIQSRGASFPEVHSEYAGESAGPFRVWLQALAHFRAVFHGSGATARDAPGLGRRASARVLALRGVPGLRPTVSI